jgi:Stress responsive A/B Barrel Domain
LKPPLLLLQFPAMFSHVVIFWTDPAKPDAADAVIAGGEKFLKTIPGLTQFHIGKMVGSTRPVVDQTYQVALNTVFASKQAQDDYQVHPQHLEFIAQCVKPFVKKVVVYDFE